MKFCNIAEVGAVQKRILEISKNAPKVGVDTTEYAPDVEARHSGLLVLLILCPAVVVKQRRLLIKAREVHILPWLQKRPLTHVAPGQPGLARPWVAWVRFFPGKCQNVQLGVRNRVSVRVFHRSLQRSEVSISIKILVDLRLIDGGQFW